MMALVDQQRRRKSGVDRSREDRERSEWYVTASVVYEMKRIRTLMMGMDAMRRCVKVVRSISGVDENIVNGSRCSRNTQRRCVDVVMSGRTRDAK
jgi:hypothetical protein